MVVAQCWIPWVKQQFIVKVVFSLYIFFFFFFGVIWTASILCLSHHLQLDILTSKQNLKPLKKELYWLPFRERFIFNLATFAFFFLFFGGSLPPYLSFCRYAILLTLFYWQDSFLHMMVAQRALVTLFRQCWCVCVCVFFFFGGGVGCGGSVCS